MPTILGFLIIILIVAGICFYLYKTDPQFQRKFKIKYTPLPEECSMYYNLVKEITEAITNKYVKNQILFLAKDEILEKYNQCKSHKNSSDEKLYKDCIEFVDFCNDYNVCKLWANSFFYIKSESFTNRFFEEYERKSFINLRKETAKYIIKIHSDSEGYPETILKMINIDYLKKEV